MLIFLSIFFWWYHRNNSNNRNYRKMVKGKRLPTGVTPLNYNIIIHPDLENFTFEGEETITLQIDHPTDTLTLNCLDIEVKSSYIKHEGIDQMLDCEKIEYNEEEEYLILKFQEIMTSGKAELVINFSGHLRDNLKGFYRSAQSTGDDKNYAAVTHFEPTGARRAFPCWDEPAMKSTFDITLVVPKEKTALSNMHVIESVTVEKDPSLKSVKFATTPRMSTYIIAFVVGDFDFVEALAENGVIVRVYLSVGKAHHGKFALEFAKNSLVFLEKYFNIPYGLKKIDLIGISDFGIGAMENWGLVIYRERYLIVDEENTATMTKQFVTEIIAHEFTHNWFGNFVSMEWWTDLWLKEGFANFIMYLCVDHFYPEFDILTQFYIKENIRAQDLDALSNSHPIEVSVDNPAQISEIFDKISYSKGAAVLRMLYAYVGDEAFRQGMNTYLKKYQYSNAVTENLWVELESSSGKPIREVMSTWTKQMGFPVVFVTRKSVSNDNIILEADQQVLKLEQKKFCVGDRQTEGYVWKVPINLACSKQGKIEKVTSLQSDDGMHLYLEHGSNTDWIKLNYGQTDYYRVKYSEELLKEMIPAIQDQSMPPIDRLGVQNDLFALVCGGYSTTVEYIALLKSYTGETNCMVWKDILNNLERLCKLYERTNSFEEFKKFVISLISPIAEKIGSVKSETDDHSTVLLRSAVYSLLGNLGHQTTLMRFNSLFNDLVKNQTSIDPDIRSAVYSTVCCHGDTKIFEQMKNLHAGCDSADEVCRILVAMGKFQDSNARKEALEYMISDNVRCQDTVAAFLGFFQSVESGHMAWDFIKSNWDTLLQRSEGGHAKSILFKMAIQDFATDAEYEDAKKFFDEHPVEIADRAIKQALDTIRNNIDWLNRLSTVCSIF